MPSHDVEQSNGWTYNKCKKCAAEISPHGTGRAYIRIDGFLYEVTDVDTTNCDDVAYAIKVMKAMRHMEPSTPTYNDGTNYNFVTNLYTTNGGIWNKTSQLQYTIDTTP